MFLSYLEEDSERVLFLKLTMIFAMCDANDIAKFNLSKQKKMVMKLYFDELGINEDIDIWTEYLESATDIESSNEIVLGFEERYEENFEKFITIYTAEELQNIAIRKQLFDIILKSVLSSMPKSLTNIQKKVILFEILAMVYADKQVVEIEEYLLRKMCIGLSIDEAYIEEMYAIVEQLTKVNSQALELITE